MHEYNFCTATVLPKIVCIPVQLAVHVTLMERKKIRWKLLLYRFSAHKRFVLAFMCQLKAVYIRFV